MQCDNIVKHLIIKYLTKGAAMKNNALKIEFLSTMMRLRKVGMPATPGEHLRFVEMLVLEKISEDGSAATEIQNDLTISKPAVSQILSALEQRGFIRRQTDPQDRRKISVTLTEAGKRIKIEKSKHVDHITGIIIERFGEENTKELVSMLNLLADIIDDIGHDEIACGECTHKGD
jgi:DNA-binding MarR family transcriptional regulator